jgi:hypothetical protein
LRHHHIGGVNDAVEEFEGIDLTYEGIATISDHTCCKCKFFEGIDLTYEGIATS